jgi:hypothetical protein
MQVGDKVIITACEESAWVGEEGIVVIPAKSKISGPGFDLDVPEEHRQIGVRIMGGALSIFVDESDVQLIG